MYEPSKINMNGYGFFEGYTHLANIFICNLQYDDDIIEKISDVIDENNEITDGITFTKNKDISVKILGYSGQKLSMISEKIVNLLKINHKQSYMNDIIN